MAEKLALVTSIISTVTPPLVGSSLKINKFSIQVNVFYMATITTLLLLSSLLLPSSHSATQSPAMPADELAALLDLVGGLVAEPGWAELHPYPCTDTPWPGVQCEAAAGEPDLLHVTGIHVGADVSFSPPCKSSAFLPPNALSSLPFLKSFSLFNCFLTPYSLSLPPSIFSNCSSLEQLVLDSNSGLTGEIPYSISKLKRLRVLCLSQNSFHGVIPREIGMLGAMQELDLSYNRFRGEIPEEIGKLLNLRIIDLSSNELHGELPSSFGSLHSLQKIDLSVNSLSGTVPPELGELKRLVLLDLSHNHIAGPLPDALAGLSELEYFLMENNPLNTIIPIFLAGLKKLQVIAISGCGLLGPIPPFFGSLLSLTALSLDRNRLNGSVPQSLGSLPKLGQLNLSQNRLSGEIGFSDEFVTRLGRRLDVRDNRGLCSRSHWFRDNGFNLKAPPCLGSTVRNGGNGGNSSGVNSGDAKISPFSNVSGGASLGHEFSFQFWPDLLWLSSFQVFAIVIMTSAAW